MPRQPVPQDPLAGLFDTAPAAFPDLNAAVFISENTKNSLNYGMGNARMMPGLSSVAQAMLEQGIDKFKRNFKSTTRIGSMAEAAGTGADIVVVLDMLIQSTGRYTIRHGLVFLTPDGREIEKVSAEATRRFQAFNVMAPIQEADDEAQQKVWAAARSSPALAEFVRSKKSSAAAASSRTFASDVDRPGYRLAESPESFALVIGVEGYQSLPAAEFAERDAAAVREHLRALGYPERNIVYLTGPKASKTGIEKYVESWLPMNAKGGSRVFVYFSGHGAPEPETGQAYLVPWDGDAKFLKNTGYPVRRLYESLNALKSDRIIVAMDACFSGAGGRSVLAKGLRPLVFKVDLAVASQGRLAVISASGADEVTGSDEPQGHGLFTYHLLKGLAEKNGDATVKELYDYLRPRVQDAARRDGRDQTPQLMPEGLGARTDVRLR
jgi:hypothetical protein